MNNKTFYILFGEALAASDRDTYIGEWATSSLFDPDPDAPAPDYDAIVAQLCNIWDVAHMSVAQIRSTTGMTQAQFAERFCLKRRTLEDWESRSKCPDHIRLMMAEILGLLTVERV